MRVSENTLDVTYLFNSQLATFPIIFWTKDQNSKDIYVKHKFSMLTYIHSGNCLYRYGDGGYQVKKGDCILLRPNVPHRIQNSRDLIVSNILYSNSVSQLYSNRPNLISLWNFLNCQEVEHQGQKVECRIFKLTVPEQNDIEDITKRARREQGHQLPFWNEELLFAFMKIAIMLFRKDKGKTFDPSEHSGRLPVKSPLFKAVTYIESNYMKSISVGDVATVACLSRSRLNRIFVEAKGCSITRFLLNTRMAHVVELLTESDLSLKEIASKCGFSDAAYLSRVFKSVFLVPPSKYKDTHRNPDVQ